MVPAVFYYIPSTQVLQVVLDGTATMSFTFGLFAPEPFRGPHSESEE